MEAGQKTVIHKTRHAGLNYGCIAPGAWTLFDAETGAQLQPIYASAGELLADLDAQHQSRFANRKPALLPAPDAMKTALDACDNYRELLAARGFTLTVDTTTAARAAHAAELARAEAQRVALEAADRLAGAVGRLNGHYAHLVLNPLWDAYRAARAKAGA
jgi:hypothetical protein